MLIIQNRCVFVTNNGQETIVHNVSTECTGKDDFFWVVVKCQIDCGSHGKCSMNKKTQCQCDEGWTGETCEKKKCPKFCSSCDNNGNCICPLGFTGRYCQIGSLI